MKKKLKNVLSENSKSWKSESAFFVWLRGGIRRSLWNRSPIKINFMNRNRFKIKNPNPNGRVKEVWGGECALCNNVFVLSELQVDHKRGNNKLSSVEDIQKFVEAVVVVESNDLQLLCKQCHGVKSYAEKHNINFKEAMRMRKIINIMKEKRDKEVLEGMGVSPASSQAGRRAQLEKYFKL